MEYKSPFLIVKDLISPLQCEDMISRLKHTIPNTDQKGNPTVTYKGNKLSEMRITPLFNQILPEVEKYYSFETKTFTPTVFEWYPTGYNGQRSTCEGYETVSKRGKSLIWNKTKDYDFTVVLFLNDYNNGTLFDSDFEVRGGKLQFPTHDFGFNPERGTAIIFPCRPNFANNISPVKAGNLNIAKFQIICKKEYAYDMDNFPGGYAEWFPDA
jgi:hypothetical protein